MGAQRTWDDVLSDSEVSEELKDRVARTRELLDEDVPALGAYVDEKYPIREGEETWRHNQRQCDLLISAAYSLYSNVSTKGKGVPGFAEYAQSIATSAVLAEGGSVPLPADAKSRIGKLGEVLMNELDFGEDFALVLFSLEQTAWKSSIKGTLGIEMLESALKSARAHERARVQKEVSATLDRLVEHLTGERSNTSDDDDGGDDDGDDDTPPPAAAETSTSTQAAP